MITTGRAAMPALASMVTTRLPVGSIRQMWPSRSARSMMYWRTAASCREGRGICVIR